MVDEREHRQQEFYGGRVVERIAPLGTGHDVVGALEPGDHLLGRAVGPHEHADPRGRIRLRERRGPLGGVREDVIGRRSRPESHPAGQILFAGCRRMRWKRG